MDRRKSYRSEYKVKAIAYAREHGTRAAAMEFEVNESMIRRWRCDEQKWLGCERDRRAFRGSKPMYPEIEAELKDWVLEQRSKNQPVQEISIRKEAIQKAKEKNLDDFVASSKWCQSFMRRNNLSTRRKKHLQLEPLPEPKP